VKEFRSMLTRRDALQILGCALASIPFRSFAQDRPGGTTFLVDTYDTLAGVATAVDVIRELQLPGPLAVRLDSGDLADLARRTRRFLDDAGLGEVRIFASGGLDEYEIERFVRESVPVDALGIGTQMGVSGDAPSLDSAYKLVAFGGRSVMKLSEGKVTLPGAKQVFRLPSPHGDVIALRSEDPPPDAEPLLEVVMRGGKRERASDRLEDARARFEADLERLPAEALDLHEPRPPVVRCSPALEELAARLASELRAAHRPPVHSP